MQCLSNTDSIFTELEKTDLKFAWNYKRSPNSSVGKESACNAGNPSSIPGSGRSAAEGIGYPLQYSWAFLEAQLVKNSPAMRETWVQSLGWEDPQEKGKPSHSSILAWRIPWTTVHGGHKDTTEWLSLSQKIPNCQRNPEEKRTKLELSPSLISDYHTKLIVKTVWYWDKIRHMHKWNRIENPQIHQGIYG